MAQNPSSGEPIQTTSLLQETEVSKRWSQSTRGYSLTV